MGVIMVAKRQRWRDTALVDPVIEQAQALVMLWDRAEDWAVPRVPSSQLRVLTVLERSGPMNLTTLAKSLGAIPSSASRLCDRLEAAGLLQRESNPGSRREVVLSVSSEGRRRLEAFAAVRRSDFAQVLELMTPQARESLVDGLQEFSAAAARAAEAAVQQA